ncbi:MAG: hypothetical protein ACR2OE_06900 [Thermomicrobiales bacterium]
MQNTLTRAETPEEQELARYLSAFEAKKQEVAALEAEIEALKDDWARFNSQYHARVGSLLVEIDRLELQAAEYDRRLQLLRHSQHPEGVNDQIDEEFAQRRERVKPEDAQSSRFRQQSARFQQEPSLTEDEAGEQKRLFRELARRFHPDLAKTEPERLERTRIMQRVTAAFHRCDLAALRQLTAQPDVDDRTFDQLPIGEKLVWAIRELSRLEMVVEARTHDLHQLRSSSLGVLWTRNLHDEDVLDRRECDARRRLEISKGKLREAIAAFERESSQS